jgi:hypothetical protein
MKLPQTNLNTRTFIAGLIAAMLVVGSFGCGKSEVQKERNTARLKFKEAVAAIKVRTQSSTYSEFRQAELDLKTSYEVNKHSLNDVSAEFDKLNALVTATDYFWDKSGVYSNAAFHGENPTEVQYLEVITPGIKSKLNISGTQKNFDPDFHPVVKGLDEIGKQAEKLLSLLSDQH